MQLDSQSVRQSGRQATVWIERTGQGGHVVRGCAAAAAAAAVAVAAGASPLG